MYRITSDKTAAARQTVDTVVERIESELGGDPRRYLVGDRLSIADITGASLLAPVVAPPGSPWDLPGPPPAVLAMREALVARPAGQWVLERYRVDRHPRGERSS
jgi:glutathione S-transferase